VLGSIGSTAAGTYLTVGTLQGIVAAGGTINAKNLNTSRALFYQQGISPASTSGATLKKVFDTGTPSPSFGAAPQYPGLVKIESNMNALTGVGPNLQFGSGPMGLVAEGATVAAVPLDGHLVEANLVVYVDNWNGAFTPDELQRVEDAICGLNAV